MKQKYMWAGLLFAYLAVCAFFLWPVKAKGEATTIAATTTPTVPHLSDRQAVWLDALVWCESRAMPGAINRKDRDGTASYGYLQFKPQTFTHYEKLYGITGTLMSSTTQKEVVTQMILRRDINWHWQFPMCTRALGLPPSK